MKIYKCFNSVVEDWFAPQWYSWNKPNSEESSSGSDSEESEEEYGEFVDGEDDMVEDFDQDAVIGREENDGGETPTVGETPGEENGAAMMTYLGTKKAAHEKPKEAQGVNETTIFKDHNDEATVGGSGMDLPGTNITLNTSINGKIEVVKLLNCRSVEVNIKEGEIKYSLPPSEILSSPAHLTQSSPNNNQTSPTSIEKTPLSQPNQTSTLDPQILSDPENTVLLTTPPQTTYAPLLRIESNQASHLVPDLPSDPPRPEKLSTPPITQTLPCPLSPLMSQLQLPKPSTPLLHPPLLVVNLNPNPLLAMVERSLLLTSTL